MGVTVGDSISRVRNVIKAVKEDPFMTDRFIYSLVSKHAKTLMKRDSQRESIYKYTGLFKEIPCIDLIEVDVVEACCIGIKTGCTFRRSKDKLPDMLEIDAGPVIRSVTTLDYSVKADQTHPSLYTNMTKTSGFKYNKNKYFWILDGYIYIPDVRWESIRLQAIFDEDVAYAICSSKAGDCYVAQEADLSIPEHLFSEIESMVLNEILTAGQIPSDGPDDGQNIMR